MCKLYIATGPLSQKQTTGALLAANQMFRSSEKDGFGFLAAKGLNIARGRYLIPHTFAGYMANLPAWLTGATIEENALPKNPDVLIVHGRTSTNTKGIDNAHPFCYRQYYLAHNGMVDWTGKREDEPKQSCDSDQLLHWLVDNKFDWKAIHNLWSGWGAVAVYDRKSGKLTIARDCAQLHIARRVNDKGWVFATSDKQLVEISRRARIALDTPPLIFPKHIVDIYNGQIVADMEWDGFGSRQWSVMDFRAAGKEKIKGKVKKAEDDNLFLKDHELFPDYEPKITAIKDNGWHE